MRSEREKKDKPLAIQKLYRRFLFYKHFVALEKPLIVTEGKTDPIYLRVAITKLADYHPQLGEFVNGKFSSAVRFLRYSKRIDKILQFGGGTGRFNKFILDYKKEINSFKFRPLAYPVIILIDNDDGAENIFSVANKNGVTDISHETTAPFYHLDTNLYLVKTPENSANSKSCIEDMFGQQWHEYTIGGKTFDSSKEHNAGGKYGKVVFAKQVIIPNADKINFVGFEKLLDRIIEVLDHYERRKSPSA